MKRIIDKLAIIMMVFTLSGLLYSYEDYYEKVYIVKISKNELYKAINATENQKKQLDKIFERAQKNAKKVEESLKKYETKKEEIGKIEKERYEKISEILSKAQLLKYNEYVNAQKISFEEKNDKIKNLLDNLNLTNIQKSKILKHDRDFKRKVEKLKTEYLSESDFSKEFYLLKEERNSKIREELTQEQKELVDKF